MKQRTELRANKLSSASSKLLEIALEKSKSAVSMDSGEEGDNSKALEMYKEAVEALQKVLDDNTDQMNNKSRLKAIVCV
jgi:hypothetical protein